jgi:N-succinyldiaminopimelate aminotransferase
MSPCPMPSFYLWADVPAAWQGNDTAFARELFALYNVTVLPGQFSCP